jgi:hypothetical protein
MKRTTIFVPPPLERDLQLYAQRENRSTASVVREALAEYLASRSPNAQLPSFAGAFDSSRADTADRHDELVFKQLRPHGDEPPRSRLRRTGARPTAGRRRR